jgi:hypothetical protein
MGFPSRKIVSIKPPVHQASLEIPTLDGDANAIKWRLKLVSKRLGENPGITQSIINKVTDATTDREELLAPKFLQLLMPNEVDMAILMAASVRRKRRPGNPIHPRTHVRGSSKD